MSADRAFNQIGEVLPTIINNGHIVGTWTWQAPHHPVACTLARGRTTPQHRNTITAHAHTVGDGLSQGWATTPTPPDDQLALL